MLSRISCIVLLTIYMAKYLFLLFTLCSFIACKNDKTAVDEFTDKKGVKNTIPASGQFNHDDMTFTYGYDKSKDETKIGIKGKSEETYTNWENVAQV